MMQALRMFIVSISGICLGYSLAHPIQDTSLSGNNLLRYNGVDNSVSRADADLPQHKSSRLGKLLGSYNNMLMAGPKNSRRNEIIDEDRKPESVGFRKSAWPGDSFVTLIPSVMNNEINQLDSQRAKRQQGWYVQYGKRSQGYFRHPESSRLQILKHAGLSLDNLASTNKESPLFTTVLNTEQDTPVVDYGTFLPGNDIEQTASDDLDRDSNASTEDNGSSDDILKVGKRDLSLQVIKTKRQQGWYTHYGKRSVADHYPGVL